MSKPEREWRYIQSLGAFCALYQGPRSRLEDRAIVGPNYMVVCDGIGGHANGDVAAELVSKLVAAQLQAVVPDITKIPQEANDLVKWQVPRAGTTCSFIYIAPGNGPVLNRMHAAHVGDSSLWLIVRGFGCTSIAQLTQGHTAWHAMRRVDQVNSRGGKNILLRWCPGPGRDDDTDSSSWDISHIGSSYDISPKLEAYIVGMTDGYSEAWAGDHGDIEDRDMATTLWRLIDTPADQREAAVRAELDRATAITRDNGTLAIWRVQ